MYVKGINKKSQWELWHSEESQDLYHQVIICFMRCVRPQLVRYTRGIFVQQHPDNLSYEGSLLLKIFKHGSLRKQQPCRALLWCVLTIYLYWLCFKISYSSTFSPPHYFSLIILFGYIPFFLRFSQPLCFELSHYIKKSQLPEMVEKGLSG